MQRGAFARPASAGPLVRAPPPPPPAPPAPEASPRRPQTHPPPPPPPPPPRLRNLPQAARNNSRDTLRHFRNCASFVVLLPGMSLAHLVRAPVFTRDAIDGALVGRRRDR